MAKETTFQVSKKDEDPVDIVFVEPESVEDDRWAELVTNYPEDINTLATQALVVKIQAGCRQRFEEGEEAMQAYADSYVYGQRGGGFRRPSLSADKVEEGGFTEEQLAMLRAAGVSVGAEEAA